MVPWTPPCGPSPRSLGILSLFQQIYHNYLIIFIFLYNGVLPERSTAAATPAPHSLNRRHAGAAPPVRRSGIGIYTCMFMIS